jgi:hypothetical protein
MFALPKAKHFLTFMEKPERDENSLCDRRPADGDVASRFTFEPT